MSTQLTDRLALSLELMELAECYAIEATLWADPEAANLLKRSARLLAEHGRQVLGSSDIEVAEAYATAGRKHLGQIVGVRRLARSILKPPTLPKHKGDRS